MSTNCFKHSQQLQYWDGGVMLLNRYRHSRFLTWPRVIAMFVLIFLHTNVLASNEIAAKVIKIEGIAYAVSESGEQRDLSIGASIFVKDSVFTGDDGLLTMRFTDKTRFELSQNANLVISEYLYGQSPDADKASMKVVKGAFRFVTGLVAKGKPENMEVETAVATIGIRGTNVIGEADATSATIILLAAEDTSRKSKIDVYNEFGKVSIDEAGYGTEIPDEFSPPSPPRRMAMRTISNLMRSMQQINRINLPRPRMP